MDADLVLGIPRGALPVARPVADALSAELDVVVASKIGAPGNPELAVGAAASDGSVWINEELADQLGVSESALERGREREAAAARKKSERYRGTAEPPSVGGRRVVLVDDGIATGATVRACLASVAGMEPDRLVLAVPVASPRTVEELAAAVDEVVALETPARFGAVGQFYRRFDQVSDEEAMAYLEGSIG